MVLSIVEPHVSGNDVAVEKPAPYKGRAGDKALARSPKNEHGGPSYGDADICQYFALCNHGFTPVSVEQDRRGAGFA